MMSKLFDREVHPDRPWVGRGYGRVRLNEPMAKDLVGILSDEVKRRLSAYHEARASGGDPVIEKSALKRASTMRERVLKMIDEQGWKDREE